MTTLTLTIGGTDFMPQYLKDSAVITEQIQNKGNSLQIRITKKSAQTAPAVGKEIILKDGSRFLFGGYITRVVPQEMGVGQIIDYTVEATDYTYLLINKYAQSSYANATLYSIVIDLLTNVASGYALTSGGVTNPGPTVMTVAFNHIPLRKCFETLAKLTGYIWYIGYDKVVYFVDPTTAITAPEAITDTSRNHETLTISYDLSQVRNDIVVLGGREESTLYTQNIVGDGNAREWVLLYPVWTMSEIDYNAVSKSFGADPTDPEGTNYFMYNSTRGAIRITAGQPTPSTSDIITVKYTYPKDVITEQQSAPSIASLISIEGGDGIHSYTIDDSTILSTDQAIQRAQKELDQYANPVISGEFVTRTGLLAGGSYFKAGQVLTINSPVYGINTDTTYIIQKMQTTIMDSGGAIEYHYAVIFGGRIFGIVDFLLALGTEAPALGADGQVRKIHANSESVTISDTASMSKYSGNSQWVPTGAQAMKWNLSQWN